MKHSVCTVNSWLYTASSGPWREKWHCTSTPNQVILFTLNLEDSKVRPAMERTQRVTCAVHPQTLVNPSGSYHRWCSGGDLPLVGCGGGNESSKPSNTKHQSRDLCPEHVAQASPVTQSRQNTGGLGMQRTKSTWTSITASYVGRWPYVILGWPEEVPEFRIKSDLLTALQR